jgi:hypothetical protein
MTPQINKLAAKIIDKHTAFLAAKEKVDAINKQLEQARNEAYWHKDVGEELEAEFVALVWDVSEPFTTGFPKQKEEQTIGVIMSDTHGFVSVFKKAEDGNFYSPYNSTKLDTDGNIYEAKADKWKLIKDFDKQSMRIVPKELIGIFSNCDFYDFEY